jgi:hypothetical protein
LVTGCFLSTGAVTLLILPREAIFLTGCLELLLLVLVFVTFFFFGFTVFILLFSALFFLFVVLVVVVNSLSVCSRAVPKMVPSSGMFCPAASVSSEPTNSTSPRGARDSQILISWLGELFGYQDKQQNDAKGSRTVQLNNIKRAT